MSKVQVQVALHKEKHPERYCPARKCLWRTDNPTNRAQPGDEPRRCPRHTLVVQKGAP